MKKIELTSIKKAEIKDGRPMRDIKILHRAIENIEEPNI